VSSDIVQYIMKCSFKVIQGHRVADKFV